jgi:hypothetical protein
MSSSPLYTAIENRFALIMQFEPIEKQKQIVKAVEAEGPVALYKDEEEYHKDIDRMFEQYGLEVMQEYETLIVGIDDPQLESWKDLPVYVFCFIWVHAKLLERVIDDFRKNPADYL